MNSGIASAMRSIENTMSSAAAQIANAFSSISYQISRNFGDMYNIGRNAAQNLANGISSVHIPMPHINVDSSTWYNGTGYSYRMSSSVSWYRKGGLFMNPAIIGLAEAGNEAVLPLEDRRAMGMIADSIMSSAPVSMDNDMITSAVSQGVAMAMMANSNNSSTPQYILNDISIDGETIARAVTKGQQSVDYRMNPVGSY